MPSCPKCGKRKLNKNKRTNRYKCPRCGTLPWSVAEPTIFVGREGRAISVPSNGRRATKQQADLLSGNSNDGNSE